jgi:hypothetical protein
MQMRFHETFTQEAFVSAPDFAAFAQSSDFKQWLSR